MIHDLSIIFLNYNTPDWTQLALKTLQKHYLSRTKLKVEVVVVDNASTDGSADMIAREFSWVKLIRSKTNDGFAAGNNLALKGVKSRYAMLINSDVECGETSNLDELVYYMDAHPDVSVITPKLLLASGQLDPASHRGEPTPWASLTYFSGLGKVFPKASLLAQYHQTHKSLDEIHEIDACSGAAMLVRTEAMNNVGLLDERFFMYAEDLDWSKRFRDAGGKVIFYPNVILTHHKYKSGRGQKNTTVAKTTSKHFYQTMLQYFDKHYRTKYPSFIRWGIQLFVWYKTR
jgi:N-acetylglucosaminyl-diphospho-decaprenol L-rhamnosyltransferase